MTSKLIIIFFSTENPTSLVREERTLATCDFIIFVAKYNFSYFCQLIKKQLTIIAVFTSHYFCGTIPSYILINRISNISQVLHNKSHFKIKSSNKASTYMHTCGYKLFLLHISKEPRILLVEWWKRLTPCYVKTCNKFGTSLFMDRGFISSKDRFHVFFKWLIEWAKTTCKNLLLHDSNNNAS